MRLTISLLPALEFKELSGKYYLSSMRFHLLNSTEHDLKNKPTNELRKHACLPEEFTWYCHTDVIVIANPLRDCHPLQHRERAAPSCSCCRKSTSGFLEWFMHSLKSRLGIDCPVCLGVHFSHWHSGSPVSSSQACFPSTHKFSRNTSQDLLDSVIPPLMSRAFPS